MGITYDNNMLLFWIGQLLKIKNFTALQVIFVLYHWRLLGATVSLGAKVNTSRQTLLMRKCSILAPGSPVRKQHKPESFTKTTAVHAGCNFSSFKLKIYNSFLKLRGLSQEL